MVVSTSIEMQFGTKSSLYVVGFAAQLDRSLIMFTVSQEVDLVYSFVSASFFFCFLFLSSSEQIVFVSKYQ